MGLEVLVPVLRGALLKVVGRVGDGALSAAEEAAQSITASVFDKVKVWFSTDGIASGDLSRLEEEPEVYGQVIQARLIKELAAEPAMQAEFAALLGQPGPQVAVLHTVADAHGITGAKIEALVRGGVSIDQRISRASDVVGAEIKRMGSPG